jgi:hypothetical protein
VSGVGKANCLSLHPTPNTLLPVFFAPLRETFLSAYETEPLLNLPHS